MSRWFIETRLKWAEDELYRKGSINRSDITDEFDVSKQTASADLVRLIERHPKLISYDKSTKRYLLIKPQERQVPLPNFLIGAEYTESTVWVGRMRKDGSKVDQIVASFDWCEEYNEDHKEFIIASVRFMISSWNSAISKRATPPAAGADQ